MLNANPKNSLYDGFLYFEEVPPFLSVCFTSGHDSMYTSTICLFNCEPLNVSQKEIGSDYLDL